jgi:hypothetical protein
MSLRMLVAAAPLLVAVTGCSAGGDADTGPTFARSPCTDFAGSTIPDDIEVGCVVGDAVQSVYAYQCTDDRTLISAGPLMGYVGEDGTYVATGAAAATPRFRGLLTECDPA